MKGPGVYQSDVEGHLLILKLNPVSCTCIICAEMCSGANYRRFCDFSAAAKDFVAKHGALSSKIANNIGELIPESIMTKS